MIISCNNCNKNFNIDSGLIPISGRLVECGACKHQWFFKKEIPNKPEETIEVDALINKTKNDNQKPEKVKVESSVSSKILNNEFNEDNVNKNIDDEVKLNPFTVSIKKKKNYNILGMIVVFIISFIALIIVLDTFQAPISKIVPNIEFILYNLYETINDIVLFLKDLG